MEHSFHQSSAGRDGAQCTSRRHAFETIGLQFGGAVDAGNWALRRLTDKLQHPIWLPKIVKSTARIGAVANLTGDANGSELTYNPTFLEVGFGDATGVNRGQVFLDVGNGPNLDFSAQGDRSGGFVQPNLKPAGISRFAGPIMSDPAQFITGKMPRGAVFPTTLGSLPMPLLFGCIPLSDIIDEVTDIVGESEKVPKLVQEVGSAVETFVSALTGLYALASDIAAQPSRIATAAMAAYEKTLADLKQQAKAYAAAQMAPILAAIDDVNAKLATVATKLASLDGISLDAVTGPLLTALTNPLSQGRASLAALRTAANATPAESLSPRASAKGF